MAILLDDGPTLVCPSCNRSTVLSAAATPTRHSPGHLYTDLGVLQEREKGSQGYSYVLQDHDRLSHLAPLSTAHTTASSVNGSTATSFSLSTRVNLSLLQSPRKVYTPAFGYVEVAEQTLAQSKELWKCSLRR